MPLCGKRILRTFRSFNKENSHRVRNRMKTFCCRWYLKQHLNVFILTSCASGSRPLRCGGSSCDWLPPPPPPGPPLPPRQRTLLGSCSPWTGGLVGERRAAPVTWRGRRSAAAVLPQRELPPLHSGVPAPRSRQSSQTRAARSALRRCQERQPGFDPCPH